ncbi:MAG: class D sortase [Clostridia bacterium]|nr:class D sortase [Clostridia bacterium]
MRKNLLSTIIIILGICIMTYPKAWELYSSYMQQRLMQEWQTSLYIVDGGEKEPPDSTTRDKNFWNTAERGYIEKNMEGIMRIEKIDLNLPILKGATNWHLKLSLASMEGSGGIGEEGNYTVTGHRSHTYGRNFNRLDELEVGDVVEVENRQNNYKYKIREKLYVDPSDIWVLDSSKREREITLITCHPMIGPTHRLVLRGRIMD